jgi:hypothetical protein
MPTVNAINSVQVLRPHNPSVICEIPIGSA